MSGEGLFDERRRFVGMIQDKSILVAGVAHALQAEQIEELLVDLRAGVKRQTGYKALLDSVKARALFNLSR